MRWLYGWGGRSGSHDAQLGYLFGPITMGQLLSLPLVLLGIAILVVSHRLARPQVGYLER